ncbi:MAG: hypothetical protein EBR09_00035 [Proteobacteria bacterium]|nr:hypothetical protein [Pseudomonadota bacterium]
MKSVFLFISAFASLAFTGCMKKSVTTLNDSTFESLVSGKNAGFRILPLTAARDALRPAVIYRCNEVRCGEAFQPSNEERDLFIPCDAALGTTAAASLKPHLRLTGAGTQRALIEKEAHRKACEQPAPFDKLVASPPATPAAVVQGAPACRVFRRDKTACEANSAMGCQWLTHPSRNGDAAGGECVGGAGSSLGGSADPNLPANTQVLSGSKPPAVWSDLTSYRPQGTNAPANLK